MCGCQDPRTEALYEAVDHFRERLNVETLDNSEVIPMMLAALLRNMRDEHGFDNAVTTLLEYVTSAVRIHEKEQRENS